MLILLISLVLSILLCFRPSASVFSLRLSVLLASWQMVQHSLWICFPYLVKLPCTMLPNQILSLLKDVSTLCLASSLKCLHLRLVMAFLFFSTQHLGLSKLASPSQ